MNTHVAFTMEIMKVTASHAEATLVGWVEPKPEYMPAPADFDRYDHAFSPGKRWCWNALDEKGWQPFRLRPLDDLEDCIVCVEARFGRKWDLDASEGEVWIWGDQDDCLASHSFGGGRYAWHLAQGALTAHTNQRVVILEDRAQILKGLPADTITMDELND